MAIFNSYVKLPEGTVLFGEIYSLKEMFELLVDINIVVGDINKNTSDS